MASVGKETIVAAYLIVNIEVRDAGAYARYRAEVSETVRRAGGRYLVRGGDATVLEGEWQPKRLVVVEFPSVDAARAWWSSPEYATLKDVRQRSTHSEMIIVEGVERKDIA
jgi:uncharacterized protein (DUF1330 family)